MSKFFIPIVDRTVWYFPSEATALVHNMQLNDLDTALDARIKHVWHENMIDIEVVDHAGKLHAIHSVTLIQPGAIGPEGRDYCEWPPALPKAADHDKAAQPTVNSLEQAIRQAGADQAPRVTLEDIEAHIASEHYFTAADGVVGAASNSDDIDTAEDLARALSIASDTPIPLGLLTICVLVLRNDFTVFGTSSCASPANYNAEIGRRLARERAIDQVWPLLGYELRNQLSAIDRLKQAA